MESIDKILEEEGYVRRLARALLTDSNDVDDIVQQVWVEALERPPRSPGSRRPWLRTVVRSLTLDRQRSDAARHRRETAAASLMAASVPSVVEVQIQESIRRQMIEELLVLPEKYRAVLILQYMRGLEPHQIATRLRLPDSTVRTRSARGREMLRRRMDARHDGDRRAWTLILAPYAGLSPAPVVALGEVLTGTRLWLVVAGVIVIAAAVTLVVNSNPPGDLTAADQVSDRFAIESPLPSEPLRREVVLDGVGRSTGHIALAGGKPASGLRYWVDWGVELPPMPGK